jgi:HSP20 family protein
LTLDKIKSDLKLDPSGDKRFDKLQKIKEKSMRLLTNPIRYVRPSILLSDFWESLDPLSGEFNDEKTAGEFRAKCDISENESAYIIALDVPGLKKEDITIELQGKLLTISGERTGESDFRSATTHKRERTFGRFSRGFEIPGGVDANSIGAVCEDGVLTISIAKAPDQKAQKIEITGASDSFMKRLSKSVGAKAG